MIFLTNFHKDKTAKPQITTVLNRGKVHLMIDRKEGFNFKKAKEPLLPKVL
jgi:hypothetical protein